MQLQLNREEKLALENNLLKENNIILQSQDIQKLRAERNKMFQDFCDKNSKKLEDVEKYDPEKGVIIFKVEEKKKKTK